jgi:hypothetical protein
MKSDKPASLWLKGTPLHRMPATHRVLRHAFVAGVQVADVQTGKEIAAHTEDISAYGCFIETFTPFPADTSVKLRITHDGQRMGELPIHVRRQEWEWHSCPLSQAVTLFWMSGSTI